MQTTDRRRSPSSLPPSMAQRLGGGAPTPMKRIIVGVLGLVVLLLLAPLVFEDFFGYRNAQQTQEVTAGLQQYSWSWDPSREQYQINASYRWEIGGQSGEFLDTQYSSPPDPAAVKGGSKPREGKDTDPPEVRPRPSMALQAYQKADGTWRVLAGGGEEALNILVICYAAILLLCLALLASGIIMRVVMRRHKSE